MSIRGRIDELRLGVDRKLEVVPEDLASASYLSFSAERTDLVGCNVFIVMVPTPVDVYDPWADSEEVAMNMASAWCQPWCLAFTMPSWLPWRTRDFPMADQRRFAPPAKRNTCFTT